MTGRGIDQVLPYPGDPTLHESYVKDARKYVELAEEANGPIQKPVPFSYIWGDSLDVLEKMSPDMRMINLETSVTRSSDYWKAKGIHYRMNPENIPCIPAAKIDCCSLANNHILDWGYAGLAETLETLERANIKKAGAGRTLGEAEAPAVLEAGGKGRVIVFSFGSVTSGIPLNWAASKESPGVNLLRDFSEKTVRAVREKVQEVKQRGDLVVVSLHWGGNWGYRIPVEQKKFAHRLIDKAGVDLIHGHSSHHVKGLEVYRGKLILYGCGDFLNDYEGIGGYDHYRDDLALMYFASLDPTTGRLVRFKMIPTQTRKFRVNRATTADGLWLSDLLSLEGKALGNRVAWHDDHTLTLEWD